MKVFIITNESGIVFVTTDEDAFLNYAWAYLDHDTQNVEIWEDGARILSKQINEVLLNKIEEE